MNPMDEIKSDATALLVLKDWLGEGGVPVSPEQANSRALACASGDDGRPCANNIEAGWWDRNVKHPIAVEIIRQLEVKTRLKIETHFDNDLHVCRVCRCCLPLKVHVPIKFVAQHTSPEMVSAMPQFCWQLKEIKSLPI